MLGKEGLICENIAPRHDSIAKVTGDAVFIDDIKVSGMIYGKLKLSPHAHARIVNIDTSKALKLPGVRSVITGKDADIRIGICAGDWTCMAVDKVRHYGEIVAAVAADTKKIAEEAADLIEVAYEVLEPILDVEDALKEDSALIHEHMEEYKPLWGVYWPEPGSNVASRIKIRKGNAEDAFKKADVIVENTYTQPQVYHATIETHGVIASWTNGNKIKIYSSAQGPFMIRGSLSMAFGIPMNDIEVHVPFIGGGFGGKSGLNLEPVAALLSKHANGKPVKIVTSREEEGIAIPCRQGMKAKTKIGATKDGKIIANETTYLWDCGGYGELAINIGRACAPAGCGPYEIDHVALDSVSVYTNHAYSNAYRGYGHAEFFFAIERQIELLAKKLGMDSCELRRRNFLRPGSIAITGELITENTGNVSACFDAVIEALGYQTDYTDEEKLEFKKTGKYRGKGVAVLHKSPGIPSNCSAGAVILMNGDGSFSLNVGGIDMGQGTYTIIQQIAAEELKVSLERISVNQEVNTNISPYDFQTVGSKMTQLTGTAVMEACNDIKKQLIDIGARVLRAAHHEVEIANETVRIKQNPHIGVSFVELALGYMYMDSGNSIGGPIIGRGNAIAQGLTFLDRETGQGKAALDWTYGAQGVEIETDINTGDVKILRSVSCFDVGKVMNDTLLTGQVIGGVIQGIGISNSEAIHYDKEGHLLNNNFTDYKMMTIKDIPEKMEAHFIETPQLDGPYGARGVGEHPMISVNAAIANAISNSIGIDLFEVPITANKLYDAINMNRQDENAEM